MLYQVIAIIWVLLALLVYFNYEGAIQQIGWGSKIICMLILIAGAPIFFLNDILSYILDIFMPEDWDK